MDASGTGSSRDPSIRSLTYGLHLLQWLDRSMMQSLNHVLVLDKPAGISSARAVDKVKRLLPKGTKIGHAGTLDPFATGVLLLLIGKATKQCERLMDQPKQYEATVKFGATTATDDPESPEEPWIPGSGLGVSPEPLRGATKSGSPPQMLGQDAQATIKPPLLGEIET